MARSHRHPTDSNDVASGRRVVQLQLFPAATYTDAQVLRARRRSRLLRLKISLTVLACGLASAGIFAGSYASWTAQTTNPGNSVTAGTLTMSNSKSASAVFSGTNVKPGDTNSGTVTVANTGSLPMTVGLTQDTVSATGIEASLRWSLHDDTRNWCVWPSNSAGACGSLGVWNAAATLTSFAMPNSVGGAQWAAAESHTFTATWQLLASSANSDQGKAGSFRLVWDGIQ